MTLAYMASPYTRYKPGIEAAFIDAARLAARLIQSGIDVYSPIVHWHPIAIHGGIDPLNQELWMRFDKAMMKACDVLIVAHMEGWEVSTGIAHEIDYFEKAGKRIYDLDPVAMKMIKRPGHAGNVLAHGKQSSEHAGSSR